MSSAAGRIDRRRLLGSAVFGAAAATTGALTMPGVLRAQGSAVRLGVRR